MALIYITDIDIFITLIKPKMIWQSTMLEMHPSFHGGNSTIFFLSQFTTCAMEWL